MPQEQQRPQNEEEKDLFEEEEEEKEEEEEEFDIDLEDLISEEEAQQAVQNYRQKGGQ